MQAHDERQIRRFGGGHVQVGGPLPADHRRQDHRVPQAGHREQFGDALQSADDHGLQVGQAHLSTPVAGGVDSTWVSAGGVARAVRRIRRTSSATGISDTAMITAMIGNR